ncbi:MAG: acyl phosphate:glycerol-3-phosphate acyltransferase [Chloroflexota bacterium]|nr:acyl phosphate:glycerol-3-phosphate acyltransferase [Chloroflexota bacterium]
MEPFDLLRGILIVAAAYLIGGIPFGVIVAKVSGGPDPRTMGSGRTGGANTMRAIGPRLALLAGLLDMVKGTVAVLLARALGAGVEVEVLAGLAVIIGHSRSPFLGFGGGRGVAPAFGGLLAFQPLIALAVLPVFIGVILVTRYSSLGSLIGSAMAGILIAIATAVIPLDPWMYLYAVGGWGLVWLFHKDNIERLLAGQERKIGTPRPEE